MGRCPRQRERQVQMPCGWRTRPRERGGWQEATGVRRATWRAPRRRCWAASSRLHGRAQDHSPAPPRALTHLRTSMCRAQGHPVKPLSAPKSCQAQGPTLQGSLSSNTGPTQRLPVPTPSRHNRRLQATMSELRPHPRLSLSPPMPRPPGVPGRPFVGGGSLPSPNVTPVETESQRGGTPRLSGQHE